MRNILMVDLIKQYNNIKSEVDKAIHEVVSSGRFIKGPQVQEFEESLAKYLGVQHVISCANGTDALQIALMAADLRPGDEVIVPAFTYAATVEVICLLSLTPVMVDVDIHSFNTTAQLIQSAITDKTRAIIPVHLFGQSTDMEDILILAEENDLFVIEDNAQAMGADYTFQNGQSKKAGTIGHIGCTSFFPSKNLGCFGDGGAMMTNDDELATRLKMIANHGQAKKYHHSIIGVNSRLDTIQAAILNIKLSKLDEYSIVRQKVAQKYDEAFAKIEQVNIPNRQANSTHVFHQYTLQISNVQRDGLREYLKDSGIPSMVYYPIPLYRQKAFAPYYNGPSLEVTEYLCDSVLSLPIHTEMNEEEQDYIIEKVVNYFE